MPHKLAWFSFDLWLWLAQILLLIFGVVVIASVAPELWLSQLGLAVVAIFLTWTIGQIDYRIGRKFIWPAYFLALILLILPLLIGTNVRGANRWLDVGFFRVQSSELAKPLLILFLAGFWEEKIFYFKKIMAGVFFLALPGGLILLQPDLGSAIIFFLVWLGMIFGAGISWRWLIGGVVVMILICPLFWLGLHDYQRERLSGFLSPDSDPLGRGYHVIQSQVAVGSGLIWGRGWGRGTQSHLRFLPEKATDFVFASLAEEWGLAGSSLLLALFLLLILRILRLAAKSRDVFGYLIALGVFGLFLSQGVINLAICVGLMPVTGITLPLVSYGGSSLVTMAICLGLVHSVGRFGKRDSLIEIN